LQLEKYSIVEAIRTIDRSDVVLLVLDAMDGVTDQDARVGGLIHEKGKGCILIVNKWDLIEKDSNTLKDFQEQVYEGLKYLAYAPMLFISAKTGQRVDRILKQVDQVMEQARQRISTAVLNRSFAQWLERLQPPLYKGRRVKLNYITQASIAPPTFLIYTNLPEGIHFSYERYLANQMREAYSFEGVPIRLFFRKKRKDR
jgi:GTP-binding protein